MRFRSPGFFFDAGLDILRRGYIRRKFFLEEYLGEVLLSLRPRLKKTKLQVTVHCPKDLQLDSYPGAFSQIVTNLIINSLVHAFDEGQEGSITIAAASRGDSLVLTYADSGKGMPVEVQKRVFDPFFTTARAKGGTGLGMHIVYNLVTQTLGGALGCESHPGQGTTFTLTLPLAPPAQT